MEGWIKLHRKIRKNPIFNDFELYRLWTICLTEATHKVREQSIGKQIVNLQPGEFVTGRFDLQDMYNSGLKRTQRISGATIWRWLKNLEEREYLNIKTNSKFSVVAVANWHIYQNDEHQNEQQVNNKWTPNDQQVITNKNVKNDKNKKKYADNVSLTEKEYKNLCNKYGKEVIDKSIEYLSFYKIEKNYKTKSDNHTIQRWVMDAVKQSHNKQKQLDLITVTQEEGDFFEDAYCKVEERNKNRYAP